MKSKTKPEPIGFGFQAPDQFFSFIQVQIQKRGLKAAEIPNGFKFENEYLTGTLTLRPITITWKTKPGMELLDTPIANGKSSASFKNISEALTFITMRLSKKS